MMVMPSLLAESTHWRTFGHLAPGKNCFCVFIRGEQVGLEDDSQKSALATTELMISAVNLPRPSRSFLTASMCRKFDSVPGVDDEASMRTLKAIKPHFQIITLRPNTASQGY
jgi:hypothetical protein